MAWCALVLWLAAGIVARADQTDEFIDAEPLEGLPATWKALTIRHLLTHTSGLVRSAPGFDPLKDQRDADVMMTAYARAGLDR